MSPKRKQATHLLLLLAFEFVVVLVGALGLVYGFFGTSAGVAVVATGVILGFMSGHDFVEIARKIDQDEGRRRR